MLIISAIDTATTGAIDATTVTTLTGTVAAANSVLTHGCCNIDGDEAVTLSDTTLAASVLNTLMGTRLVLGMRIVTTRRYGCGREHSYGSSGISNLGDEAVTLSDTDIWRLLF